MVTGAVLYAKQLTNLVDFYATLGLEVDELQPGDYAVLKGAAGELSIVQIPDHLAAQIEIAIPPEIRSRTPIKLAFVVSSIDYALEAASSLGGSTDDGSRRWEFRGHAIQDAIDPEGNVYQLRERLGA
jgi:hypothetical protein